MTDAFVQMPLTKMVDLVINSPEEGVVNFNLLHTVLQVIVKQLNVQDLSVELHGAGAERLQNIVKTADAGTSPTVNITVVGVGGGPAETRDASSGTKTEKKDTATETVFVVQPVESAQNCGMTVTKKQLDLLHAEMECVKDKLQELTELPGNMGIIDAVRQNDTCSPVIDMFQILSLTKRMDATEIGTSKLASIVEDLIKNPAYADKGVCTKLSKSKADFETKDKAEGGEDRLNGMSSSEALAFVMEEVTNLKEMVTTGNFTVGDLCSAEAKMTLSELFEVACQLRDKFLRKREDGEECEDLDLPPDVQLALLQDRFAEYTKHIDDMDRCFNDELSKLHNQFTDIEKDFNEILAKIQGGMPAGDSDSNQCCAAVYHKLAQLQTDFEALTETSTKLIEDKDDKSQTMDRMLEEIELLKTIKADKEDLEEALAEKADACTVLRKVSHDQFDNACDELYKGIEEALSKLSQQEELWQHALDDIQNEIGCKLDKMDLGPLREFINNKLKQLQDKMRSLAALKREQEAAGTKSKLLRDVNCISCDKDVVMRKELDPSSKPPAYSAPPTRSMAPYLAYELDVLRKQQKGIPGAKNLNNLEAALTGKGGKKADDHICNRYCGGSHTLTTPQQRVTRLGHFLLQWGPEALPKDESKPEMKSKDVQTRSQSMVVQADILSSKKSIMVINPSSGKLVSSKSTVKPISKQSFTKSVEKSTSKLSATIEEKKPSRPSQGSGKSMHSIKSTTKKASSKIQEETIEEVPTEEGAGEAPPSSAEPVTESETTAPPPTRNDDLAEGEAGEAPPPPPAEEAPAAPAPAPPEEEPPPPSE